jgi:hypothetical protein
MSRSVSAMLALLICAAPALAAQPMKREAIAGSRVVQDVQKEVADTDRVRRIQLAYGECVVKSHVSAARRWVLVPDLDDVERRQLFEKVADANCLSAASRGMDGVEMRFPGDTLRHTLAEALVLRDLTPASLPAFAKAGRYAQPTFAEADFVPKPGTKTKPEELARLAENRRKRIALVYLAEFGECVVRRDPGQGLSLVIAAPASSGESAAFQRLMPSFGQCLAPGESLTFNKAALRGTIALNLYRLANAQRVTAAVGATR